MTINVRSISGAAAVAFVFAILMGGAATQDQDADWRLYLVQVQHIARQDPAPADLRRIEQLEARLAEAVDAKDRERVADAIEKARETASKRAGYIIYGDAAQADRRGAPISSSKTTSAFLLPFNRTTTNALAEAEPGVYLVIQRSGTTRLFSYSGRAFLAARNVGAAQHEADWPEPKSFVPISEEAAQPDRCKAAAATLTHIKSTPRESGVLHRYTMRVKDVSIPESADNCMVWLHVRLKTIRGKSYGPVLMQHEFRQSEDGRFWLNYSFDLFAPERVPLEAADASVEVVGVDWAP